MKKQLMLFLSFLFIYGCSSSSDENSSDENSTEINVPGTNVTDIDGNVLIALSTVIKRGPKPTSMYPSTLMEPQSLK
jgi:hypothetical protein